MKKFRCSSCKHKKSEDEFSWSNKNEGIRNNRCKECQRKLGKQHYIENKSNYLDTQRVIRDRNKKFICDYLADKFCVDCNEDDIVVLEFDHIDPTKKDISVSNAIDNKWSLKRLLNEISKCEIRCSNCHKKRHARESNSYRYTFLK
jgi:hypothetical protein